MSRPGRHAGDSGASAAAWVISPVADDVVRRRSWSNGRSEQHWRGPDGDTQARAHASTRTSDGGQTSAALPSPFPPIAEYAFLSDCHTGSAGRARRCGRLAVRAPVRLAERVRQPARSEAGMFRFGPFGINVPTARHYEPGTNVLVTTWKTPSGWVVVRDALTMGPSTGPDTVTPHTRPPADDDAEHMLVRVAECLERSRRDGGRLRAGLRLRAGAGDVEHRRRRRAMSPTRPAATSRCGCTPICRVGVEGGRVRGRHVLEAGDRLYCALSWAEDLVGTGRRRRRRSAHRRPRSSSGGGGWTGRGSRIIATASRSSARRSPSRG